MWRSTINYGRKGLAIQSISAVDIAIWDVLGKLKEEPVYNLVGGKTKEKLPVYMTNCDAKKSKDLGFYGAKIPLPFGPGDGDEGFQKNLEFIRLNRENVGPDFPLMIDCYMSLNPIYTIKLAHACK